MLASSYADDAVTSVAILVTVDESGNGDLVQPLRRCQLGRNVRGSMCLPGLCVKPPLKQEKGNHTWLTLLVLSSLAKCHLLSLAHKPPQI
ncbi:hypothetical protein V6N13_018543 [Hibiscus sabdariffa]